MSHFYAMGFREVMDLRIDSFWAMNAMIHRLMAETDLRGLTVANAAQSEEGAHSTRQNLIVEMGEVVRHDPLAVELDKEGLNALRVLQG